VSRNAFLLTGIVVAGLCLIIALGALIRETARAEANARARKDAGQVRVEGWVLPADYPAVVEALNRAKAPLVEASPQGPVK
jgi:hypothetical protein